MKNYKYKVMVILAHLGLCGLLLCGTAYAYGLSALLPGLIVGLLTGIVYFFHLYYQIERLSGIANEQAPAYICWGWTGRLSLLVLIFILLSQWFDISSTAFIIGFFTTPVILFLNTAFLLGRQIADSYGKIRSVNYGAWRSRNWSA